MNFYTTGTPKKGTTKRDDLRKHALRVTVTSTSQKKRLPGVIFLVGQRIWTTISPNPRGPSVQPDESSSRFPVSFGVLARGLKSGAQPESDLHPSTCQKHAPRLSKLRREERKKERKGHYHTDAGRRALSRPEKRRKYKNEEKFLREILDAGVGQVILSNWSILFELQKQKTRWYCGLRVSRFFFEKSWSIVWEKSCFMKDCSGGFINPLHRNK